MAETSHNDYLWQIYNETLWGAAWFSWYDFPDCGRVLVAGSIGRMALTELGRRFGAVDIWNGSPQASKKYGAVLVGGSLGSMADNEAFLREAVTMLTVGGVLLWVADNKLGTRFLCGDKHFGDEGEYFTRCQWQEMFQKCGLCSVKGYGLMPGWHLLRNVFAEGCLLTRGHLQRLEYHYTAPENLFRDEHELLGELTGTELFPWAGAFLWEYHRGGRDRLLYADMYGDKPREEATVFMHFVERKVVKKPLYSGGSVAHIYRHGEELRGQGLRVVSQKYANDRITMPYLELPLLADVMAETAARDENTFWTLLDGWWECIVQSSVRSAASAFPLSLPVGEIILAKVYADMSPTNAFWDGGECVFFDQEYCCVDYPARFALYRGLVSLYAARPDLAKYVPLQWVQEHFSLADVWENFVVVDYKYFVGRARNLSLFNRYNCEHVCQSRQMEKNGHALSRLAYLMELDLFAGSEGKKIVLFGAGEYCRRYLQRHGKEHLPSFIVDNDAAKWHTFLGTVEILPPGVLKDFDNEGLHIIICCSRTETIGRQLRNMGLEDYRIF